MGEGQKRGGEREYRAGSMWGAQRGTLSHDLEIMILVKIQSGILNGLSLIDVSKEIPLKSNYFLFKLM